MNKNISLLLSLLMVCTLSVAKTQKQQVSSNTFLETDPDKEEVIEITECDDQSLILVADAGIFDIQYSNNDFILDFALPPHSLLLHEAGWQEYNMGWLFPVEATEQPKCFVDIKLELSDSHFPRQDMVVVNSQPNLCQPSSSGFLCRLSIDSPTISILLDKTDSIKQIALSVPEHSKCSLTDIGTLYFGKVIKPLFMPLEHKIRPQVIQLFHLTGGSGSSSKMPDSDGGDEDNEQPPPQPSTSDSGHINGAHQDTQGDSNPFMSFVHTQPVYTPPTVLPGGFGAPAFSIPAYSGGPSAAGLMGAAPVSYGLSRASMGAGSFFTFPPQTSGAPFNIPPYNSLAWNWFISVCLSPYGQFLFNLMRTQLAMSSLVARAPAQPPTTTTGTGTHPATTSTTGITFQSPLQSCAAAARQSLPGLISADTEGLNLLATAATASGSTRVGPIQGSRKRKCRTMRTVRAVFSEKQVKELEKKFAEKKYLSVPDRTALADQLEMGETQVTNWFQNRRGKEKKQDIKAKPTSEDSDQDRDDSDSSRDEREDNPGWSKRKKPKKER